MKRVICVVIVAFGFCALTFGQTQDPIEKALLAAPAAMKDKAMVIKWKSDFTYDTLRNGTNRLACYERPTQPGDQPFSIECTSVGNLERVAQSLKTEAAYKDAKERRAAFEALEKAGKWSKPEFGSVFYNLTGSSQAAAHAHETICVPGATMQTLGFPENGEKGGAWVMYPGTSAAHLMLPGQ